jgi:hypothetical protein
VFRAVTPRVCAALAGCLALAIVGCGESHVRAEADAAIDAGVAYPSSAAYDGRAKVLLVGSYDDGSVQRVPVAGGAPQKRMAALPQDGREHVLRVRFDDKRDRIWILDAAGVYLYEAATSRLIHRWPLEQTQHSLQHCLPDIAVHPSGALYESSAVAPKIWRIDGASFAVTEHDIQADSDHGKDFGFSALAFAGDSGTLYAASATTGSLWKIDSDRNEATKLALPGPAYGACALRAVRESAGQGSASQWSLYVAGGFQEGVMRIQLAASGAPYKVTAVKRGMRAVVPTDFVQTDRELLLVSSHLSEHPDFNGEGRLRMPFKLVSFLDR